MQACLLTVYRFGSLLQKIGWRSVVWKDTSLFVLILLPDEALGWSESTIVQRCMSTVRSLVSLLSEVSFFLLLLVFPLVNFLVLPPSVTYILREDLQETKLIYQHRTF